jgi:hypothetical protein
VRSTLLIFRGQRTAPASLGVVGPALCENQVDRFAEHKLRADINGDVEILDVSWNGHVPTTRDVAPPILAYADLTATADGRNLEAEDDL